MGLQNQQTQPATGDANRVIKMGDWNKHTQGKAQYVAPKQKHGRTFGQVQQRTCRICGKTARSGDLCKSCADFINKMNDASKTWGYAPRNGGKGKA